MKNLTRIISMLLCIVLAASLCACGGVSKETAEKSLADDMSKHVELNWMIRVGQPEGFEEVMVAANEYLKEKLNVTLNLQCVEPADYASKTQLALASGEKVDIMWTANWGGFDYESNVAKGAFMPLDDLLALPELEGLKNYYKDGIWEASTVAGKIYGIPMEQVFHTQKGYAFVKDVAAKYNLVDRIYDLAWVDDKNHGTMEELEEVFDIVRTGEPSDFVISVEGVFNTLDPYVSTVREYKVKDFKVVDDYDERLENARRARRWNEKGYFPADIATLEDKSLYINQGKAFAIYNRYLPGVEAKWRLKQDYDAICIPTREAVIDRKGIQSTLNAITSTSKNPIRALKLIELMLTDEYLMNLLSYGIEGRDYTRDPDNPKRMLDRTGDYYISEYMIGSQFLAYLVPTYEDGVWEQTKRENESARIDDLIGFSFDPSPVETEISQVSAAGSEYARIIQNGLQDPEIAFVEREKKLNLAGNRVVIDEIQRQIDQWRASQK